MPHRVHPSALATHECSGSEWVDAVQGSQCLLRAHTRPPGLTKWAARTNLPATADVMTPPYARGPDVVLKLHVYIIALYLPFSCTPTY